MDANEIETIVKKLLLLVNANRSKEYIESLEEFNIFKEKNKMFYELILKGEHDPVVFNQMMKMKRRLEAGEDQYSVDVRFGTYMASKYIDPVIKDRKV